MRRLLGGRCTTPSRNSKSVDGFVELIQDHFRPIIFKHHILFNGIFQGNIRVFGRVRPLLGEEMVGCESNMPPHIGFPHNDNRIIEIEKVNPVSPNEVFVS